jgi:glycosyltransferase involved in cell wall biosynthesis
MPTGKAASRKLRIAQVAPLSVRVPPTHYGGTERVVFELTEELVRRGHDVTLFAPATSQTSARLCAGAPRPLWELDAHERLAYEVAQVDQVASKAERFDIIHWHIEYLHWFVTASLGTPSVTTLHGRLDGQSVRELFIRNPTQPMISISDAQRLPVADLDLNWVGTIHHGLDLAATYELGPGDGGYLAFVGRSSADKGLATAIRVAIRADTPIRIAARVGPFHHEYHESEVVPLLAHPLVHWLGEVADQDKAELLAHARALLMPIEWDEPFGLSFIESMAAGTPVITKARGALTEIMRHGEHGFFAETEDELVEACMRVDRIDRSACRSWAVDRFSTSRMADDYEAAYVRVIQDARAGWSKDTLQLGAVGAANARRGF